MINWDWEPTDDEVESGGPLVGGLTFWQAVLQVGVSRDTKPLADFIADREARGTITDKGWRAVRECFVSLGKTGMAGNPHNAPADQDVREAARWVDEQKRHWREQTGKSHVPPNITNGFIQAAIDRIAERRGVVIAVDSGKRANWERWIRNALKSGRLKAHSIPNN